ncbi:MAG: type II secretion system protein [Cellvibrio sp.]|uniref:pilus assembly FimT family protein n=1 Tax=Cellvibrio sp. TaxID=1965322 RepID=UPI0031A93E61
MNVRSWGFTLIELIAVMILLGILSVALFSRLDSVRVSAVQSGRDDLIAALFFAQQTAMARTGQNRVIRLQISAGQISVTENVIGTGASTKIIYSIAMPRGATLTPAVILSYDKLGRTTPQNIMVTGSGNSAGVTASVRLEGSGYAFAN